MRKSIIVFLSFAFAFILSAGIQAQAVTIDFDSQQTLEQIAEANNITFKNAVIVSDVNTEIKLENSRLGATQKVDDNGTLVFDVFNNPVYNDIYILFETPIISFSCDKWEEPSGFTVTWEFFDENTPIFTQTNGGNPFYWANDISFNFTGQATKIKISGTKLFYLDNLKFDTKTSTSVAPEPATMLLLGLGLLGLTGARRKFQK